MWEKVRVGWYERTALKHVLLPYVKHDQCKFNAWSRALKAVLWDNPMQWGGEGGGRGIQDGGTPVHPWLIHVDVWQNYHNIIK